MKAFTIVALTMAAAVQAIDSTSEQYDTHHDLNMMHHEQLNAHYDNTDPEHHYYGTQDAASPAYPAAPMLHEAVNAFNPHGTLFGEHRYQLQVGKTGNMLIGTEALRVAVANLQARVSAARDMVHSNDGKIEANDREISWNR